MFNYRQSNVIEKNTFVDEFEAESVAPVQTREVSDEEREFNARISDNFDRIINYDSYSRKEAVQERAQTVSSFVNGVNYEISPSATTMQYKDMAKAEIYQDYRVESGYYTQTKVRPGAKVVVAILTLIVAILSALVVLNTALLGNMNALIGNRLSEVEMLEAEYASLTEELESVSSDQSIIDAALDLGMKG